MYHYTDYEAALIYLTLVFKFRLAGHSTQFRKELQECEWLEQLFDRHSFGSVSLRWNDFRTAVNPDLKATRGARLPQVRRIVEDWEWLTGLSLRPDLIPVAA